jgi:hypothetical protein
LLLLLGRELPLLDLSQAQKQIERLFEADNLQPFAFLPTRGNLPFLVFWTRNSAVRFSARVLEFNGAEYHDSDGWIEQYQYEDEDDEFMSLAC